MNSVAGIEILRQNVFKRKKLNLIKPKEALNSMAWDKELIL